MPHREQAVVAAFSTLTTDELQALVMEPYLELRRARVTIGDE